MSLDDLLLAATQILGESCESEEAPKTNENGNGELFLESVSKLDEFPKENKKKEKIKSPPQPENGAKKGVLSTIHSGDTDSSDDEQNRDYESAKYNDYGKEVKQLLSSDQPSASRDDGFFKKNNATWKSKPPNGAKNSNNVLKEIGLKEDSSLTVTKDVYTDPVFGIRIVKPLISSSMLQDRMVGRDAVHLAKLKWYISKLTSDKNWVIAGVIVRKTTGKTSAKGNSYSIWTLSDLHGDIKTVTVFLFSNANKELWKLSIGTVVGILNPSVLENKSGKDEATLSVDNAQKVMVLGQSKDFGTCKSTTKSGEKCTAIVNTGRCEFCIYHVSNEYQKCSSGRQDLQSSFAGRGLTALRNKVLGKNEVFYAGKSYTAVPAKKSKKLEAKDQQRLSALSGMKQVDKDIHTSPGFLGQAANIKKKAAVRLDISYGQKAKDMALLQKLGGGASASTSINGTQDPISSSTNVTLEQSKSNALSVIAKLKAKQNCDENKALNQNIVEKSVPVQQQSVENTEKPKSNSMLGFVPKLSTWNGDINLNAERASRKQMNRAKLNAFRYIKEKGPLQKADPMAVRGSSKKRSIDEVIENASKDPKKQKIMENEFMSDRFKKMMAATSSHRDLLEQHDNEQQEKYFKKQEMKERLEEKMMSTYKIECKAVRCLKCKYTSFSASDLCKAEKHPLKVFDSFKRFFKCGSCGNRTCCLEIVPLHACKNCGSGKWERTTMMKEKIVQGETLSIRGGEQTFVNSQATNANINLLVPDD